MVSDWQPIDFENDEPPMGKMVLIRGEDGQVDLAHWVTLDDEDYDSVMWFDKNDEEVDFEPTVWYEIPPLEQED